MVPYLGMCLILSCSFTNETLTCAYAFSMIRIYAHQHVNHGYFCTAQKHTFVKLLILHVNVCCLCVLFFICFLGCVVLPGLLFKTRSVLSPTLHLQSLSLRIEHYSECLMFRFHIEAIWSGEDGNVADDDCEVYQHC